MVFIVLLLISPEMRKAQMLTIFTPTFALGLLYSRSNLDPRSKRLALGATLVAFVLVLVSSGGWGKSALRGVLISYGSFTMVLLVLGGVLAALHRRSASDLEPAPPT